MPEKFKALLVDDEPDVQEILDLAIHDAFTNYQNIETVFSQNGSDALEQLSSSIFDIIIADLNMPKLSGTEMIHHLRANNGPNKDIPVIIISGAISYHKTEGIYNIHYLIKPFEFTRLIRILRLVHAGQLAS